VLSPDGSSTVHIYTQIINGTTQITTNLEVCGLCHVFASFTLAFAIQLRKKHRKTAVRVRKTVSVRKIVRVKKTARVTGQLILQTHNINPIGIHINRILHTSDYVVLSLNWILNVQAIAKKCI
jgi:hypothetical protein